MLDHTDPLRIAQHSFQDIARQAKYLNKLPSHQVLRCILAGAVENFPADSVILSEGAEITDIYLILRGLAAVSIYKDANPALWLYVAGPGSLVDVCALLEPPTSPVTTRALTDLEVLAIPRGVFVDVMKEEAAVGFEILQELCSRLALINQVTLKEFSRGYPEPSRN